VDCCFGWARWLDAAVDTGRRCQSTGTRALPRKRYGADLTITPSKSKPNTAAIKMPIATIE
jgi:hypothetical protein